MKTFKMLNARGETLRIAEAADSLDVELYGLRYVPGYSRCEATPGYHATLRVPYQAPKLIAGAPAATSAPARVAEATDDAQFEATMRRLGESLHYSGPMLEAFVRGRDGFSGRGTPLAPLVEPRELEERSGRVVRRKAAPSGDGWPAGSPWGTKPGQTTELREPLRESDGSADDAERLLEEAFTKLMGSAEAGKLAARGRRSW
jgi:hypothetical protein